eukprot:CAMPEP_0118925624 /NCGR_PEP_ID=MMETSP1169-20130426/3485_1 /TAXON_ID=36882 /ORGANISM="Pyramimonas obovata, Strain CCMP722" /LENGTH=205 /DNA_ID=CAMNT_0006866973 /DNA_START=300 /DNA_END=914 /DNA_ORIENTATION=-
MPVQTNSVGHAQLNLTALAALQQALADPATGMLMDSAVLLPCGHSIASNLSLGLHMCPAPGCGAAVPMSSSFPPNINLRNAAQAFQVLVDTLQGKGSATPGMTASLPCSQPHSLAPASTTPAPHTASASAHATALLLGGGGAPPASAAAAAAVPAHMAPALSLAGLAQSAPSTLTALPANLAALSQKFALPAALFGATTSAGMPA